MTQDEQGLEKEVNGYLRNTKDFLKLKQLVKMDEEIAFKEYEENLNQAYEKMGKNKDF